ncbi:MAG: hypothetical protein ACC662_10035, partial [Planctomycetota bacterium]
ARARPAARPPSAPPGPLSLLLLASCAPSFSVENRETPVHVLLAVPEFACEGGLIDASIRIDGRTVVSGPIRFPRGVTDVILPTLYLRDGEGKSVEAVLDGGRIRTRASFPLRGETWVRIVVRRQAARVEVSGQTPISPKSSSFPIRLPGG